MIYQNLSSRTISRLPVRALAMYTEADPCPFSEAINALSCMVGDAEALIEHT